MDWIKNLRPGDQVLVDRIHIGTVVRITGTGCVRLSDGRLFGPSGREKTRSPNWAQIGPYSEDVHKMALMRHMAHKLASLSPEAYMRMDPAVLAAAYDLLIRQTEIG